MKEQLGFVVAGSLSEGFSVRINSNVSLEHIKTGKFVTIVDEKSVFFSLITDLKLEVTNPDIILFPPNEEQKLLINSLKKRHTYVVAHVKPMLMLNQFNQIVPVKTIPVHFSSVSEANEKDVALVFGKEEEYESRYFMIGSPLDMDTPVCIDLERLTERSNGIFGKTGTGKTFLTRLVLAGLIKHQKAVTIIFDMHSEYGVQARQEGKNKNFVKGLKALFPDRVSIFSLDPHSTRRRGNAPDVTISIPYHEIHVEDIISLQSELNLHATALEAAYLIVAKYKKQWLSTLLSHGENLKDFAQSIGAHPESVAALYRKLKRIERLSFFVEGAKEQGSVIDQMMEYIDKDINIIIEFGNFSSTFCYLLVANIITRRLHDEYIAKTEKFLGTQRAEDEPKKLMITIEEAHKFLNPIAAQQTIFGTIAREMRKYYVSLLVVDQRPSGIDSEILSQIGTKIVAQLNDERDIAGVLTGVNNASNLRGILASLDTKKQVLLLGHAVAMPVVVQTREYDETFYQAMNSGLTQKKRKEIIDELF